MEGIIITLLQVIFIISLTAAMLYFLVMFAMVAIPIYIDVHTWLSQKLAERRHRKRLLRLAKLEDKYPHITVGGLFADEFKKKEKL